MGKHDTNNRKRRVIDLSNLSRKQRKLYREERKPNRVKEKEESTSDNDEQIESNDEQSDKNIDVETSSDEEVTDNPYNQLINTLSTKQQSHKDSDEESESDDNSNDDDDDNDDDGDDDDDEDSDVNVNDEELKDKKVNKEAGNVDNDDDKTEQDKGDNDENDDDSNDVDDGEITGVVNDDDDDDDDDTLQGTDPFVVHFERDLEDKSVDYMKDCKKLNKEQIQFDGIGQAVYQWPIDELKPAVTQSKDLDLDKLHVKQFLRTNLNAANKNLCGVKDGLTPLQSTLFSIMNNYQDILYSDRTFKNGEEIRLTYCLHAVNHILKSRKRVLSHNTKIKNKGGKVDVDEDYRDQGLTRPKVLMVLPFRDAAKKVVYTIMQLLNPEDKGFVSNKKRFFQEYEPQEEESPFESRKPKDFLDTFSGNIDDHFRIGLTITKKTVRLYTRFYATDIILTSPLGLRTLIGSEGDKERDYDFLNSIEMLIIDQADILMMQNWDHVLHIMKHLHLQPLEAHDVDFSRVRMWTLNGWSKYYRQSLIFRSVHVPEISALFNKHCCNYAGKIEFQKIPGNGTICQIAAQLPQVFHRIECSSYSTLCDERFDLFTKKIFPHMRNTGMTQTVIFVPSYFDYVRLRNYFQKEGIKFLQACEYTQEKKVNTARNLFYHRRVPFMLYTERIHFYKRYVLRGIRHLVFYSLPQYPHFYSDMCNMLNDVKSKYRQQNQTCTVLYSKFDALRLAEVVGTDRAKQMIYSEKSVHMFVTGDGD
ncbi:hypothetical protein ACF0H5_003799 [Mactra antiquata]